MFHMQSTYLLKLTVRLTLQFVFVSPLNVHLGQTRSLGLKVWGGHKTFLVGQDFVFVIYFNKKCSWQNKIWRITKNLGGITPECLPWLQVWFQFSRYLVKPTLFDETK